MLFQRQQHFLDFNFRGENFDDKKSERQGLTAVLEGWNINLENSKNVISILGLLLFIDWRRYGFDRSVK